MNRSPFPLRGGVGVSVPTANSQALVKRARKLRHAMTEGEWRLWREIREFRRLYGLHVRRQAPVGRYVADFAIHERKLIIEVDGEQHFSDEGLERDKVRDNWLAAGVIEFFASRPRCE